jgi:hypothetical protein
LKIQSSSVTICSLKQSFSNQMFKAAPSDDVWGLFDDPVGLNRSGDQKSARERVAVGAGADDERRASGGAQRAAAGQSDCHSPSLTQEGLQPSVLDNRWMIGDSHHTAGSALK